MTVYRITNYVLAPSKRDAYILRDLADNASTAVEEVSQEDVKRSQHESLRLVNGDDVGSAFR